MAASLRPPEAQGEGRCGPPLHPNRPPDHRDEKRAVAEQALGGAFRIRHGHGSDQPVAFVEIIDAIAFGLQPREMAGDLGRGIEA